MIRLVWYSFWVEKFKHKNRNFPTTQSLITLNFIHICFCFYNVWLDSTVWLYALTKCIDIKCVALNVFYRAMHFIRIWIYHKFVKQMWLMIASLYAWKTISHYRKETATFIFFSVQLHLMLKGIVERCQNSYYDNKQNTHLQFNGLHNKNVILSYERKVLAFKSKEIFITYFDG